MGKGIVVVDIPKYCKNCLFCIGEEMEEMCCSLADDENETDCFRTIEDYFQKRPDWCPIKLIPEKLETSRGMINRLKDQIRGYNACIDEILKGEE